VLLAKIRGFTPKQVIAGKATQRSLVGHSYGEMMQLGDAVRAAYRTYVSQSRDVLPFYFLGTAVPMVARTLPLVAVAIGYLVLWQTGRIDTVTTLLADVGPIPIDQPTDVSLSANQIEQLQAVLLIPEVTVPLVVAAFASLGVLIMLNAAVSAGQLHGAYGGLRGRNGVRDAVDGTFRDTRTFIGLVVAEVMSYIGYIGVIGGLGLVVARVSEVAGVLVGAVGVLGALVVVPAVRLVFAFASVAVVVDNVGVFGALWNTLGYARRRPGAVLGYGGLAVTAFVVVGVVSSVLAVIGGATAGPLVLILGLWPLLDLCKLSVYANVPQKSPRPGSVRSHVRRGLAAGWRALVEFTTDQWRYVLVAGGVFGSAVGLGWTAGGAMTEIFTASIEQRLKGAMAPGQFVRYAANNWQVATAQSFAGLGLGVPAVISLGFNGAFLGALFRLEVAPAVLLAFVVPHGLIEIPGLAISGGVGLYLGAVAWHYVTGTADRDTLTSGIQTAYRVLLGLAMLFVIAAAIEAVVSPYYWRLLPLF